MPQIKGNRLGADAFSLKTHLRPSRGVQRSLRLLVIVLSLFQTLNGEPLQAQHTQQRTVPIPHPMTSLLRAKGVHRELDLQRDQMDEIARAVDDTDLPLWRLRDLPIENRNGAARRLISQLKLRLSGILSTKQLDRLNQIVWQGLGIDAILEPEVVAKLKLSPKQIRNISAFLDLGYKKLGELQRQAQTRSESNQALHLQKLRNDTQQNIMTVLGSSQQQMFTRLLGDRFAFSQVRSIACKAPELEVNTWINASPLSLSEQRGNVTVVHFYAFGCGNCVRTLPHFNAWQNRFADRGLRIIGIHRPETQQERDLDKVKDKAAEAGMNYPVAIDNDSLAWNAWANNVWPSIYLIDKNGYIRYWWYGELNWQGAESELFLRGKIQELIREEHSGEQIAAM
jgi:thiol-disulfide isomerase/thioredoxin